MTDSSLTNPGPTAVSILAGPVISLAGYTVGGTNYLLCGTSIGIIANFNWDAKTLVNLVVITGVTQVISQIKIDTTPAYGPVAYYATSTYSTTPGVQVGRINLGNPSSISIVSSTALATHTMSAQVLSFNLSSPLLILFLGLLLHRIKVMNIYPSQRFLEIGTGMASDTGYSYLIRINMTGPFFSPSLPCQHLLTLPWPRWRSL